MEEMLSVLIINVDARRRPPFSMFPLVGRGRNAVCLLIDSTKDEAFLRYLWKFLLLNGVGSLRLYVFCTFCCEHIV